MILSLAYVHILAKAIKIHHKGKLSGVRYIVKDASAPLLFPAKKGTGLPGAVPCVLARVVAKSAKERDAENAEDAGVR